MTEETPIPIDWDDIRARYEGDAEEVKAIAASIGISQPALSAHAKRHGWTMRKPMIDKSTSTIETLRRLREGLQKQLFLLEAKRAAREDKDAAMDESENRDIGMLLRNLEKVLELENKQSQHRRRRAGELARRNDAERDELARRIGGLCAEGQGGCAGGETADPGRAPPAVGMAAVGADRPASA